MSNGQSEAFLEKAPAGTTNFLKDLISNVSLDIMAPMGTMQEEIPDLA